VSERFPRIDHMEAECPRCKRAFGFSVRSWADGDTRPRTIVLRKHSPCEVVCVEIDGPTWDLLVAVGDGGRGRPRRKP